MSVGHAGVEPASRTNYSNNKTYDITLTTIWPKEARASQQVPR